MIGLIFLAVIGTYIVLNIFLISYLWKKFSRQTASILTLIILSIPIADQFTGELILNRSCRNETNVVIERTIQNVEKIFLPNGVSKDSPSYYGYKITEELGYYNNAGYVPKGFEIVQKPKEKLLVRRATMTSDARSATLEQKMEPVAEYGLRVQRGKTFWLDVERYFTVNRKGTEELGSFYWYSFRGGWVARLFSMGGSSSTSCGSFEELNQKKIELLHTTLKPAL